MIIPPRRRPLPIPFLSFNDNFIFFSKKWKKLLTFPHISECISLSTTLKADNYDYIIGEQPIGAALFRQFCQVNKVFPKNKVFKGTEYDISSDPSIQR